MTQPQKTWHERGAYDAGEFPASLMSPVERLRYIRSSYNFRLDLDKAKRSLKSYREYLCGFYSVLRMNAKQEVKQ